MDEALARTLIELDCAFYRAHAASFSATRQAPWPGWQRVADLAGDALAPGSSPAVLDLACGNLRFERFLSERARGCAPVFFAVDSCPELATAADGLDVRYRRSDVLTELLSGRDPLAGVPSCDLVACFGFMHHVPGIDLRLGLARALARRLAPGGLLACSFWRFMDDPRLAAKAGAADARAADLLGARAARLEAGDHFLGWQDDASALRYCHHAAESEIDRISAELDRLGVDEVDRFCADGRTGRLNRYLVCRRR